MAPRRQKFTRRFGPSGRAGRPRASSAAALCSRLGCQRALFSGAVKLSAGAMTTRPNSALSASAVSRGAVRGRRAPDSSPSNRSPCTPQLHVGEAGEQDSGLFVGPPRLENAREQPACRGEEVRVERARLSKGTFFKAGVEIFPMERAGAKVEPHARGALLHAAQLARRAYSEV